MIRLLKVLGFPTKEEIISAIADEVETRMGSAVLQPLLDELDKQVKNYNGDDRVF